MLRFGYLYSRVLSAFWPSGLGIGGTVVFGGLLWVDITLLSKVWRRGNYGFSCYWRFRWTEDLGLVLEMQIPQKGIRDSRDRFVFGEELGGE